VLRGRTALVIAHRLSTVQIADRVLVMAGGRIVEDGTPGDLTARQGQFARLHRAWLGSNSPAPAGREPDPDAALPVRGPARFPAGQIQPWNHIRDSQDEYGSTW
jgi:ABC-type multidrug transport system ATPase subunit